MFGDLIKLVQWLYFFKKTTEMNGSNHVGIPLRPSTILKYEIGDKYCFVWSILDSLHPCEISHPNRVSNYRHYFDELKFQGFDSSNEFKCSFVHKLQKLNILSIIFFEINFNQDQSNWKQKIIPTEVSKNDSY